MGLSDEELAAEFIHSAAIVDANALLKDERGVEYQEPRILGLIDSMKKEASEFKAYEFLSKEYMTLDASELPDGTVVNMSVRGFLQAG